MEKKTFNDMSRADLEKLARAIYGTNSIEGSTDYTGPNKYTADKQENTKWSY